jgi:hypothetical protein
LPRMPPKAQICLISAGADFFFERFGVVIRSNQESRVVGQLGRHCGLTQYRDKRILYQPRSSGQRVMRV